jgi:RNA polymerase sigma factor (sigma-70 family)
VTVDRSAATGIPGLTPKTATVFEAFYETHQVTWLRYAHAHVGASEYAEEIVDEVTAQLVRTWDHALRQQSNVESYAWALLKTAVARWLAERGAEPAFIQTSAFDRVVRTQRCARERFGVMEESLGLYSAMLKLPERQYDVIVLRYVLGYSDHRTGSLLGMDPRTIQSHIGFAKQKLARRFAVACADSGRDAG